MFVGKAPDESLCTSPQDGKKRVDEATGGMPRLYPGDRVRVALDADTLRHLQQGHGGWNPRMSDVCFISDFELFMYTDICTYMYVIMYNEAFFFAVYWKSRYRT